MREIKFQAFIEKDGKIEKYSCGVFNNEVIISTNIPYVGQAFVKLTSKYGKLIGLRQYTGLKDKNGTKIFEGDLLTDYGEAPPLYVEYSEEHGAYCFVDKFDPSGTVYYTPLMIYYEQMEVIGNIYEHPHLLEEQHG